MMKRSARHAVVVAASLLCFSWTVHAYDEYSSITISCKTCHLAFTEYNLHNVHRNDMLNGDCDVCHSSVYMPVYIGRSSGGRGLAPVSCMGCHGRAEDGAGTGSEGYGAALRQRHWRANIPAHGTTSRICIDCHADSDPASTTVVSEYILPPYYAQQGTDHPSMPFDPCNRAPVYGEDFTFSTRGLDNDGDMLFDELDPDCSAMPGEAGGVGSGSLVVNSYDNARGEITVSYGPGCAATDHHVEIGMLTPMALSTYAWTDRICNLGCTGTASFHLGAESVFFVIVGNIGTWEGSYGKSSAGVERPEGVSSASCSEIPQALVNRCD